jgi:hypothetical protein
MESLARAGTDAPARRRALRLAVGTALGVGAGALLASAPAYFVLGTGVLALSALLLVNPRIGFLLGGALLLLQLPIENVLAEVPETELFVRYADETVILLLVVAFAWHALGRLRRMRAIVLPLLALAGAMVFGLAAALVHQAPTKAAVLDIFSLCKWGMILFAANQLESGAEATLRVLRTITLVAAGLAALGWLDLLWPALTHDYLPIAGPIAYRSGLRCLVSVFPNEGYSGWFFAAASCLPIAGYLVARRRADLWLSVFLLVTSCFSYRRKPILGMAFALGVLLLTKTEIRNKKRVLAAAAITAAIVIPILGTPLRGIFQDSWNTYVAPRDAMQIARNAMYITSWRIGKDYFPIGAGLGLFGGHASTIYYSEFYVRYGLDRVWGLALDSENSPNFVMDAFFPHVIGALGLLGAALYLFGLLYPAAALLRAGRHVRDPAVRILVTAALLVTLEALAESVAAPIYEVSFQCFVVFGLTGAVLSVLASTAAADAMGGAGAGTAFAPSGPAAARHSARSM